MADARALLRNQRETRKINHPFASYTSSGKLLCSLCNTQVKTESLWTNHLRAPDHITRAQKLQTASSEVSSKKRKADPDADDGRKRAKGLGTGVEDSLEETAPLSETPDHEATDLAQSSAVDEDDSGENGKRPYTQPDTAPVDDEDEEWLALQQAIDAAPALKRPAVPPPAVISAPAVSAEEVAAQAREEQSTQRGGRDEEIAAEKEDAARALDDEFREMEELEDRVRRLREKREAIRAGRTAEDAAAAGSAIASAIAQNAPVAQGAAAEIVAEDEDDDNDEEDEDDFDDWKFGAN